MFTCLMCTDETCAILDEISLIDPDNNCIKEKAECRKKQIILFFLNGRKLDDWFDW